MKYQLCTNALKKIDNYRLSCLKDLPGIKLIRVEYCNFAEFVWTLRSLV